MHRLRVLGYVMVVALVALLAGCDTYTAPVGVVIPNVYQGTWMMAALDDEGQLVGVGMFRVDQFGQVHIVESEVYVTGEVTQGGALTLEGTVDGDDLSATGTMNADDTGQGTWQVMENGVPRANGTFLIWRANGGAYAGVWDVTVSGAATGAGPVTVDANGVITGTATVEGQSISVFGVVTGDGTVVVAWTTLSGSAFVGRGPADGTASGATATGNWASSDGMTGTWTATKR